MTSKPYLVVWASLEVSRDLDLLLDDMNFDALAQLDMLFDQILENDPYAVILGLCGPVGAGVLSVSGKGPMRHLRLEDRPGGVVVWYWINEDQHRVIVERIR